MDDCCEINDLSHLRAEHRRLLTIVLVINAVMFIAEFAGAIAVGSTSLLADSFDMLGDAIVYGFSLVVVGKSIQWQARASMLKGSIMALSGMGVMIEAVVRTLRGTVPEAKWMTVVGVVVLAANVACLALLSRHRADNINMQSAFQCSKNDVVSNMGVLVAAALIALTGSHWPDVVVGVIIAGIILRSARSVIIESGRALRRKPV